MEDLPWYEQEDEVVDDDENFSVVAWKEVTKGKSQREIAALHEAWAVRLCAPVHADFDKAQAHLDQALELLGGYHEPSLVARTWCLKGSCSGKAGDYLTAAASFKRAQQLAEEADDALLTVSAQINHAICDIHLGDAKAAATRSRRAFARAEAMGGLERQMFARCVRAASYMMVGNFLTAHNEHECAVKFTTGSGVGLLDPGLSVTLHTNRGISMLRSSKPERAIAVFDEALEIARKKSSGRSPLTVARCFFHAGEARRQAGQLATARTYLDEASAIIGTRIERGAEALAPGERSRWTSLALEVAKSKGLSMLSARVQVFNGNLSADRGKMTQVERSRKLSCVETRQDAVPGNETERFDRMGPPAEAAALTFAAGDALTERGAHDVQKIHSALLEGMAWSLAGSGNVEGVTSIKKADQITEELMKRAKTSATSEQQAAVAETSEAIGESVPAGSESDGHLRALHVGVLCSQGIVARGGLGLGVGCTSGGESRPAAEKGKKGAAGALAAVAAARTASKSASAGWAMAGQLAKKQLAYAAQLPTGSPRQLAVAHAHAGAIDVMTGRPTEASHHFESQRQEAHKVGDTVLGAIAERNLADVREFEGDLAGALRHLRRYRGLAQRGGNAALEADACRRLSCVYAEIAAESQAQSPSRADAETRLGEPGMAYRLDGSDLSESEMEEREDNTDFLGRNAAFRAGLFAERYDAAVTGLLWPLSAEGNDGIRCNGADRLAIDDPGH